MADSQGLTVNQCEVVLIVPHSTHTHTHTHCTCMRTCPCVLHALLCLVHVFPILCCSPDLLAQLLQSPDLYVMQVEMDAYTLAKRVSMSSNP